MAGITGGVGMAAGASIGRDHALFSQGCRHTGRDIAGKNKLKIRKKYCKSFGLACVFFVIIETFRIA